MWRRRSDSCSSCGLLDSDFQLGAPVFVLFNNNSWLALRSPMWRMLAHARPPPRTNPSPGVRGHPASTYNVRTPFMSVSWCPTIVEFPVRNRCPSCLAIRILAPSRFASPARVVNSAISQSTPALRNRSFEFFSDRYSAMSLRPASRACRSASSNAAAHASSSSLIFARRWYHERRIVPPHPRYGTYRNEPILSSLKTPFDRDPGGGAVSTDQRKPVCSDDQTPGAHNSCQRFCRSDRQRNQGAPRKPPATTAGEERSEERRV